MTPTPAVSKPVPAPAPAARAKSGVSDFDPPPFSVDDEPPAALIKPSPRTADEPAPLPLGHGADPEQLSPAPRATVPLKALPTVGPKSSEGKAKSSKPAPAELAPIPHEEPQPLEAAVGEPTPAEPLQAAPAKAPPSVKAARPTPAPTSSAPARSEQQTEPIPAEPMQAEPMQAEPMQAEPVVEKAPPKSKPIRTKPVEPQPFEAQPTPAPAPRAAEEAGRPAEAETAPAKAGRPQEKSAPAENEAEAMEAEPIAPEPKSAAKPSEAQPTDPKPKAEPKVEAEPKAEPEAEPEAPVVKAAPPVQVRPRVFASFGVAGPDGKSADGSAPSEVDGESIKELLGSETTPASPRDASPRPRTDDPEHESTTKAPAKGDAATGGEEPGAASAGSAAAKPEGGSKKRSTLLDTLSPDLIRPESAEPIYEDAKGAGPKVKRDSDLPALTAETTVLGERVREARALYQERVPNTKDDTHHDVLQHILAFGVAAELRIESIPPKVVNAIAYECYNNPCRGEELLYIERNAVAARKAARAQTHYGQYLAVLAQSGVALDYPLKVKGKTFTVADLVETEKRDCESNMELSFKLLALSYYVGDSDETWRNATGQDWNLERLIREEIAAPVVDEQSFGGTQRLLALSAAVRRRQGEGKPLDGQFGRAAKYVSDFHRYTLTLQNTDGSFSTEFFKKKSAEGDLQKKLAATGMVLEWLVFSLDRRDLDHPLIVRGMEYLTDLLIKYPKEKWDPSALGHALHALRVYEERFLAPAPSAAAPNQTAQRSLAPPAPAGSAPVTSTPVVVAGSPPKAPANPAATSVPRTAAAAPSGKVVRSTLAPKAAGKPAPAPVRTADRTAPHAIR